MKSLALLAVLIATPAVAPTAATAAPRTMSQHPREGLLAEIEFHEGSTRLPDAAGSQLGQIAAWADENFDGLVVIDGHADSRGPAAGNVRLSLRRARLVRDQLLAIGVDPGQIIISAFGPERRTKARVAVWGTHTSLDQVIAMHRHADELIVPRARQLDMDQTRHARPSPVRPRSHTQQRSPRL